jgi:hypothetical protein
MLDGSVRRRWRSRDGVSVSPVRQTVLCKVVVSQFLRQKVRALRPAEMGKLKYAEPRLTGLQRGRHNVRFGQ